MERKEILKRLGYAALPAAKVRVIVDSDVKNEADDPYAIMHHLLVPTFDVRGILATHFEQKVGYSGDSMERSYQGALQLMELAEIDDVPVLRGCRYPLADKKDAPDSESVRFLIEEAKRDDPRPLYIAIQGAMTNVAAAINRAPEIAKKLVVLWNGGGPYPEGGREFNLMQDADACRVVLESEAEVWQTPRNVYGSFEVSFAELSYRVRPCGALGEYMFQEILAENEREYNPDFLLRTGENWVLGDNTTVGMLIESRRRGHFHEQAAPVIEEDLSYGVTQNGKKIRVYDSLDTRLILEDMFCRLELAYGKGKR